MTMESQRDMIVGTRSPDRDDLAVSAEEIPASLDPAAPSADGPHADLMEDRDLAAAGSEPQEDRPPAVESAAEEEAAEAEVREGDVAPVLEPEPGPVAGLPDPKPPAPPSDPDKKDPKPSLFEWIEIQTGTIRKIESVFVPPPDYAGVLARCGRETSEERVILVRGPRHTGRFTCAVHLALDLQRRRPERRLKLYRRGEGKSLSLVDLAGREQIQTGTVCLVEDVFDQGVGEADFAERFLDIINTALSEREAFLVLTSLDEGQPDVGAAKLHTIRTDGVDLARVLAAHLRWYQGDTGTSRLAPAVADRAQEMGLALIGLLKTPLRVDQFCRKLCEQRLSPRRIDPQDPAWAEAIRKVAERVGRDDPHLALRRFRQLSDNARLFALLVGLFRGVHRRDVEVIFADQVQRLKADGLKLDDIRQVGIEDLIETIQAREAAGGTLQFIEPEFEAEVARQLGNYHPLLWSVVASLWEDVDRFKAPKHWGFRVMLGAAIGRVGVHYPEKLAQELTPIAGADHGGIASVAAYALQEIARLGREHDRLLVDELLRPWAESGEPNLMWTAAGAIWRVYEPLAQEAAGPPDTGPRKQAGRVLAQLSELLTGLAGRHDRFSDAARRRLADRLLAEDPDCARRRPPITRYDHLFTLPPRERVPIQQWLREALDAVVQERIEYNRTAIIRAIVEIHRQQPQAAVALLCQWLSAGVAPEQDAEEPRREDGPETGAGESPGEGGPETGAEKPPSDGEPEADATAAELTPEQTNLRRLGEDAAAELFLAHRNPDPLLRDRHEPLLQLVSRLLGTRQETVDQMLATLETWLKDDVWRRTVQAELLRALNRARKARRRKMIRVLSGAWLRSKRPEIRAVAQGLIARARILDGAPVDLPGQGAGVLLLDASAEARQDRVAADAGFEAFHHLQPQVDLWVGNLGQVRPVATPGAGLVPEGLLVGHDQPRLLLPALEGLDPARVHYVLVLNAEEALDGPDAAEGPWGERLVPIPLQITRAPAPSELEDLPPVLRVAYQYLSGQVRRWETEQVVEMASLVADSLLGAGLAGRSAAHGWEALRGALPEGTGPEPRAVRAALEALVGRLDEPAEPASGPDPARVIAFGVQWLAAADLAEAVRLLADWLAGPAEDPRTLMALACSRRLFLAQVEPALRALAQKRPGPAAEPFGRLLELGPLWAKLDDWPLVRALLDLVRGCAGDPAWVERVGRGADGPSPELVRMLQKLRPRFVVAARKRLARWAQPREDLGETAAPPAAARLADWLGLRLRFGRRKGLGPLPEGHAYGVLIVDPGRPGSGERDRLRKLAAGLFKKLNGDGPGTLRVVAFRVGERLPAAVSGERPTPEALVPAELPAPARVVGPILEGLPAAQVRFVLLLAARPPADGDDWIPDWEAKGLVYSGAAGERPRWAPGWEFIPRQTDEEDEILRRLKNRP